MQNYLYNCHQNYFKFPRVQFSICFILLKGRDNRVDPNYWVDNGSTRLTMQLPYFEGIPTNIYKQHSKIWIRALLLAHSWLNRKSVEKRIQPGTQIGRVGTNWKKERRRVHVHQRLRYRRIFRLETTVDIAFLCSLVTVSMCWFSFSFSKSYENYIYSQIKKDQITAEIDYLGSLDESKKMCFSASSNRCDYEIQNWKSCENSLFFSLVKLLAWKAT